MRCQSPWGTTCVTPHDVLSLHELAARAMEGLLAGRPHGAEALKVSPSKLAALAYTVAKAMVQEGRRHDDPA